MIYSQNWYAFYNSIHIETKKNVTIRFSATIKTENLVSHSQAALWIRIENKNAEIGYFDNMSNRPITSSEWTKISLSGNIDEDFNYIFFGGLCNNYGNFHFKDFRLEVESNNGEFYNIDLNNLNYNLLENNANGWKQGIGSEPSKLIEEYSILAYKENKSLDSCLLISGREYPEPTDYSSRIYLLIRSLEKVSKKMIRNVQNSSIEELDFIPNLNINSIGNILIHITSVEFYYQRLTFENRLLDEKESRQWFSAIKMDENCRKQFKNYSIEYYLNEYRKVRKHTLDLFKSKEDTWLDLIPSNSQEDNYSCWLHVMEHQSYHLGQIVQLFKIKK